MTLRSRLATVVGGKLEALLSRLEDPGAALDLAYRQLVEQLAAARTALADLDEVRAGLAEVAGRLEAVVGRLEQRARAAVGPARDDLAREAVTRALALADGARSLRAEATELGAERDRFAAATDRLDDRVRALGGRREALKLQGDRRLTAEAAAAVGEEAERARDAVRRAERAATDRRAQVRRVESLLWSGTVEDLSATPAALEEELARTRASGEVDAALARLRRR